MAEPGVTAEAKTEVFETCNSTESERTLPLEALNNFVQGKRHLLVQDYSFAVSNLEKACELYATHYGETAPECGEVYFHYGKALFRLFQKESGFLGDVLPEGSNEDEDEERESGSEEDKEAPGNASDDDDDDDEEEEEEEEIEKMDADTSSPSEVEAIEKKDCNEANVEKGEECATSTTADSKTSAKKVDENEVKAGSSDSNVIDCGPSGSNTQPKKPEAEEEISDLQLAWETLETAKSIFKKQGNNNREAQLKVAEILIILAEISMESENYAAAIEDLKQCLQLHQQYLNSDDRLIAETYYQMGLAYTFDSQFTEAIENFKNTVDVIELRIRSLKNQSVPEQCGGFDVDPAIEISELESLLPDIRLKIEDTQDMMQSTIKQIEDLAFKKIEEVKIEQVSSTSSSSAKPVSNITHLLKRKKPEDQDSSSKAAEVKKIKLSSPVINGDNPVVPDSTLPESTL